MTSRKVWQFKITLCKINPSIWRRILVPDSFTFWDLHVAIQDSMGWKDMHLHQFIVKEDREEYYYEIGIPENEEDTVEAGWIEPIKSVFSLKNKFSEYLYDFGDSWRHIIEFEGSFPRITGKKYPVCLEGARACPPENCGGTYGYNRLVNHPGRFKSENFDASKVRFMNSRIRLAKMKDGVDW